MSSRASSKCGWTGWRTPRFEKSNLAQTSQELRMRTKYARKLSILLLFLEIQHTFSFPAETQ